MAYPFVAKAKQVSLELVQSIDAETVLHVGLYVGEVTVGLFVFRTVCVVATRALGLFHPDHYHRYPRLIPWRTPYTTLMSFQAWKERVFRMGSQSSGGFAGTLATLTLLYKPGKVFMGRATAYGIPLLQPLGFDVRRHIMMFAMTGAFKTTLLITMIHCWIGSAVAIDPKGQITVALATKDKKRHWHILDVYDITGLANASFNVIDVIKEAIERDGPDAAVRWAQRIAECLIETPEGSRTPYFYNTPRAFLVGVILHVLTTHPEENHNLPFIRTLIVEGYRIYDPDTGVEETNGDEAFRLLLASMKKNTAYGGVIAGAVAALESASGETFGNVLSTLYEQTKWLDIPEIRRALMRSTFSISDLKTRNDLVFSLVAPVLSIREELKDLFRLITNMTAYVFEAVKQKKGLCLFAVDELPSLGYSKVFEVMLPVARSWGLIFLGIAQDVELLKKAYPKTWQTFIGNADVVFWMGTNHQDNLQYLANVLGKRTIVEIDQKTGHKSLREVWVADPDQLRRLLNPKSGRIVYTFPGMRARHGVVDPYFKALSVRHYNPDPDEAEAILRRIVRWLLQQ